ncbi:MAG: hypothetical protein Q8T13_16400 [Acidobacteriota bacterium]|nr:hypothetical protein [Acidobacteriota bacterium]
MTIEGDPDGRTYYAEIGTPPDSGLKPGDFVWVELGATWAIVGGRKERVGGQWRQCVVLHHEGAVVHARFSPAGQSIEPFG